MFWALSGNVGCFTIAVSGFGVVCICFLGLDFTVYCHGYKAVEP